MEKMKTGFCPEFIIHPGETLQEVIENKEMTQKELALRAGVSEAYISKIINGEKGISTSLSKKFEYIFGIETSFWINLQTNYDKEILDFQELNQISEDEKIIVNSNLKNVVKCFKDSEIISPYNDVVSKVFEMRKALNVSNLTLIPKLSYKAAYRADCHTDMDVYVMYAWQCLCELRAKQIDLRNSLDIELLKKSINDIKEVMFLPTELMETTLTSIFHKCGIAFCIIPNFPKAPVQGFIKEFGNKKIMLCLTIRKSFADIFWFTLFHEVAHIINRDYDKIMIDYTFKMNDDIEIKADLFARNVLIPDSQYNDFEDMGDFSLSAIKDFSKKYRIKPYILIGRLQKNEKISYTKFSDEKIRYKWVEN